MIEKFKTLYWFLQRPSYWQHAAALIHRKFLPDLDKPQLRQQATDWAKQRSISLEQALKQFKLLDDEQPLPALSQEAIDAAQTRQNQSRVSMGGPGDVNLLYALCTLAGAKTVIETGVAYGWSSFAVLSAISNHDSAKLISIDMPYPKRQNDDFVGIVVPEEMRAHWQLIRQPDRPALRNAIASLTAPLDLCHYDSDKSWWGRTYAYPKLWDALRPGGFFISDDIQDNMAFAEFVQQRDENFAVVEFDGKYVGLCQKAA